ncbi:uncharacterized protein [Mytilus edulis]|uniref:uncharacterized protein isoform X2 n=1 Tax=Mytilus edulis TaxID=6550 RepID=UPI0039F1050B
MFTSKIQSIFWTAVILILIMVFTGSVKGQSDQTFQGRINITSVTWNSNLAIRDSQEFMNLSTKLVEIITCAFADNTPDLLDNTDIQNFTQDGGVIATFKLELNTIKNTSEILDIMKKVTGNCTESSDFTTSSLTIQAVKTIGQPPGPSPPSLDSKTTTMAPSSMVIAPTITAQPDITSSITSPQDVSSTISPSSPHQPVSSDHVLVSTQPLPRDSSAVVQTAVSSSQQMIVTTLNVIETASLGSSSSPEVKRGTRIDSSTIDMSPIAMVSSGHMVSGLYDNITSTEAGYWSQQHSEEINPTSNHMFYTSFELNSESQFLSVKAESFLKTLDKTQVPDAEKGTLMSISSNVVGINTNPTRAIVSEVTETMDSALLLNTETLNSLEITSSLASYNYQLSSISIPPALSISKSVDISEIPGESSVTKSAESLTFPQQIPSNNSLVVGQPNFENQFKISQLSGINVQSSTFDSVIPQSSEMVLESSVLTRTSLQQSLERPQIVTKLASVPPSIASTSNLLETSFNMESSQRLVNTNKATATSFLGGVLSSYKSDDFITSSKMTGMSEEANADKTTTTPLVEGITKYSQSDSSSVAESLSGTIDGQSDAVSEINPSLSSTILTKSIYVSEVKLAESNMSLTKKNIKETTSSNFLMSERIIVATAPFKQEASDSSLSGTGNSTIELSNAITEPSVTLVKESKAYSTISDTSLPQSSTPTESETYLAAQSMSIASSLGTTVAISVAKMKLIDNTKSAKLSVTEAGQILNSSYKNMITSAGTNVEESTASSTVSISDSMQPSLQLTDSILAASASLQLTDRIVSASALPGMPIIPKLTSTQHEVKSSEMYSSYMHAEQVTSVDKVTKMHVTSSLDVEHTTDESVKPTATSLYKLHESSKSSSDLPLVPSLSSTSNYTGVEQTRSSSLSPIDGTFVVTPFPSTSILSNQNDIATKSISWEDHPSSIGATLSLFTSIFDLPTEYSSPNNQGSGNLNMNSLRTVSSHALSSHVSSLIEATPISPPLSTGIPTQSDKPILLSTTEKSPSQTTQSQSEKAERSAPNDILNSMVLTQTLPTPGTVSNKPSTTSMLLPPSTFVMDTASVVFEPVDDLSSISPSESLAITTQTKSSLVSYGESKLYISSSTILEELSSVFKTKKTLPSTASLLKLESTPSSTVLDYLRTAIIEQSTKISEQSLQSSEQPPQRSTTFPVYSSSMESHLSDTIHPAVTAVEASSVSSLSKTSTLMNDNNSYLTGSVSRVMDSGSLMTSQNPPILESFVAASSETSIYYETRTSISKKALQITPTLSSSISQQTESDIGKSAMPSSAYILSDKSEITSSVSRDNSSVEYEYVTSSYAETISLPEFSVSVLPLDVKPDVTSVSESQPLSLPLLTTPPILSTSTLDVVSSPIISLPLALTDSSSSLHVPELSTSSPVQPMSSSAPVKPMSSSAPVQPLSSSAPVQPMSSSAPVQLTSSAAPVQPMSSSAPVQPMASSVPVQPMSSEAPVQLTSSEAGVQPMSSSAPVQPMSSSAAVQPISSSALIQPMSSSAPIQPMSSSAPVQPMSSSAPVQPISSSAPVQPMASSAPVQPMSSEAPVQPMSSEAPVQLTSSEAGVQPMSSSAPVQPMSSSAAVQPISSSAPVQPMSSEVPVQLTSSEAAVQPMSSSALVQPMSSEAPVQPMSSSAAVEPMPSSAVVEPMSSSAPVQPMSSSAPVQPMSSEAPVQRTSSDAAVQPMSSSAPVQPMSSSAPVQPMSSSISVQPMSSSAPVQPMSSSISVQPMSSSAAVQPMSSSAPVQTMSSSAQVQPMSSSAAVQPMSSSISVQPMSSSAPVQPMSSSAAVQPMSSSEQVQSMSLSAPVQPMSSSAPVQPLTSSAPVQPMSSSDHVQPMSSEASVQPTSSADHVQFTSSDAFIHPSASETPVQETSSIATVHLTSTEPSIQSSTEVHVQPSPSDTHVQTTTSIVHVQPSSTEAHTQSMSTGSYEQSTTEVPIQPSSSQAPVQPMSSEVSEQQTPTQVPVQPSSTEVTMHMSTTVAHVQSSTTEVHVQLSSSEAPVQQTSRTDTFTESLVQATSSGVETSIGLESQTSVVPVMSTGEPFQPSSVPPVSSTGVLVHPSSTQSLTSSEAQVQPTSDSSDSQMQASSSGLLMSSMATTPSLSSAGPVMTTETPVQQSSATPEISTKIPVQQSSATPTMSTEVPTQSSSVYTMSTPALAHSSSAAPVASTEKAVESSSSLHLMSTQTPIQPSSTLAVKSSEVSVQQSSSVLVMSTGLHIQSSSPTLVTSTGVPVQQSSSALHVTSSQIIVQPSSAAFLTSTEAPIESSSTPVMSTKDHVQSSSVEPVTSTGELVQPSSTEHVMSSQVSVEPSSASPVVSTQAPMQSSSSTPVTSTEIIVQPSTSVPVASTQVETSSLVPVVSTQIEVQSSSSAHVASTQATIQSSSSTVLTSSAAPVQPTSSAPFTTSEAVKPSSQTVVASSTESHIQSSSSDVVASTEAPMQTSTPVLVESTSSVVQMVSSSTYSPAVSSSEAVTSSIAPSTTVTLTSSEVPTTTTTEASTTQSTSTETTTRAVVSTTPEPSTTPEASTTPTTTTTPVPTTQPLPVITYQIDGSLRITGGESWSAALANKNSPEYNALEKKLRNMLKEVYGSGASGSRFYSVGLITFTQGSIIATFKLNYTGSGAMNMTELNNHMISKVNSGSFGDLVIDKAAITHSIAIQPSTPAPSTTQPIPASTEKATDKSELPLPPWGIAVIVCGALVLIFLLTMIAILCTRRQTRMMKYRMSDDMDPDDIGYRRSWGNGETNHAYDNKQEAMAVNEEMKHPVPFFNIENSETKELDPQKTTAL